MGSDSICHPYTTSRSAVSNSYVGRTYIHAGAFCHWRWFWDGISMSVMTYSDDLPGGSTCQHLSIWMPASPARPEHERAEEHPAGEEARVQEGPAEADRTVDRDKVVE